VPHFFYLLSPKQEALVSDRSLAGDLEGSVEELGYELVELEQAGTASRPILRLRIDRADAEPGQGVGVDDCARVSRALSAELDSRPGLSPNYVLEVSSPGIERPLVRSKDFERFVGEEVALHGKRVLADRTKRLEGVLLGLRHGAAGGTVALRLPDGAEVEIARGDISRAHLIYRDIRQARKTNSRGGKSGS
jgi:ribosome maturation factor RimP